MQRRSRWWHWVRLLAGAGGLSCSRSGPAPEHRGPSIPFDTLYAPNAVADSGAPSEIFTLPTSPLCGDGKRQQSVLAGDVPVKVTVPMMHSSAALPLVLLSHGVSGPNTDLDWLSQQLARAGYIAVSMQHDRKDNCAPLPIPPTDDQMNDRRRDAESVLAHLPALLADINERYALRAAGVSLSHDGKVGFAGFSLGVETGLMIANGEYQLRGSVAMRKSSPEAVDAYFFMAGNLGGFSYGKGWGTLGFDNSPANVAKFDRPVFMATAGGDGAMHARGLLEWMDKLRPGLGYHVHAPTLGHETYCGAESEWTSVLGQLSTAFFDAALIPTGSPRQIRARAALLRATESADGSFDFMSNKKKVASLRGTGIGGATSVPGAFGFRDRPVRVSK